MPISFSSPSNRDIGARGAGVTAVLGPTNTGKTHLAIERMLGHSSGIIGLPLRLLAREVYNKIVERMGVEAVALVTGEEKIKPANPRFWVATVEAMPRDLDVAFVAIDEVQLGADLERGHVFTDRMLNRRGREETLVLGAATVRSMVERLLPGAHVLTRPRLSQLTFAGEKKLTRLPRRSAIVAFSVDEVYAIAELIRRQHGGAAVVLGALSPRTRNAQVALYQSGDVDYLVATDAIGMGLNLDVDHVAFASDRKFDGYQFRKLNPAELAQIAGRAGRATRDGTFGTTGRCPPFETELAQALESHAFESIRMLQWRNTALDFFSLGALQATLAEVPKENGLTRAPVAEDILVLDHAARDDEIRALATTREAVERLWGVCQVPDYRKISPATHAELVTTLYGYLMREGTIPTDWFSRQVDEADRPDGDIDTISNRIAHIRTWTFAANRPDWLADPEHWQAITRGVEDKLSDALHERLAERFVDRRTSVLMRRLRENTTLTTEISKTGEVVVEGHALGRLDGFVFTPQASAAGSEAKTLAGAAQKALAGEIDARAMRLAQAADAHFLLTADGTIRWLGQAVGKIVAAEDALKPRVRIIADEQLTGAPREAVQSRLDFWLKLHIERILAPLFQLLAGDDVTGIARGVAFQLVEELGVLERARVANEVKGLDQPARATLRKYGVRFGAYHIYLPALIKPAPRVLALQLYALKHGGSQGKGFEAIEQLAASGRTSIAADKEISKTFYRIAGYRVCGERAVRIDILERLADLIRPALAWRAGGSGPKPAGALDGAGFIVAPVMTSLAGCSGEDFASILRSLGFRMEKREKPVETPPSGGETTPAEVASAEAPTTGEAVAAGDASAEAPTAVREVLPARIAPAEPQALATVEPTQPGTAATPSAELAPDAGFEPIAPLEFSVEPVVEPAAEMASEHETVAAAVADAAAAPAESVSSPVAALPTIAQPQPSATGPLEETAEPAPGFAAVESEPPVAIAAEEISAPGQPELIEVWRPGRADGQRRQQRSPSSARRREPRGAAAQLSGAATPASAETASTAGEGTVPPPAATAAPAAAEAAPATPPHRHRRRHGRPAQADAHPDRERSADLAERASHRERAARPERPEPSEHRQRGHRRMDRDARPERGERPERDPDLRAKYIKGRSEGRERRDKAPDPNSPFAKLAALKAQLEANTKEPR